MNFNLKIAIIAFLMSLPFNGFCQDTNYPNNVVVILDTSGSMAEHMSGGSKIDVAKVALKSVINDIPSNTNVGIITFHGVVLPIQKITNKNNVFKIIDSISTGGNTPLGEYMKIGADALLEKRKKQLNYGDFTLLVLTDGEANDGLLVNKYAPEIMSRGVNLDVIGISMKKDHSLKKMSNSYKSGEDLNALKSGIKEVFAEFSSDESDAQEYFNLIAPIPDESAIQIINALTNNINTPIGEVKKIASASRGVAPSSNSSNTINYFTVIGSVLFIMMLSAIGYSAFQNL